MDLLPPTMTRGQQDVSVNLKMTSDQVGGYRLERTSRLRIN